VILPEQHGSQPSRRNPRAAVPNAAPGSNLWPPTAAREQSCQGESFKPCSTGTAVVGHGAPSDSSCACNHSITPPSTYQSPFLPDLSQNAQNAREVRRQAAEGSARGWASRAQPEGFQGTRRLLLLLRQAGRHPLRPQDSPGARAAAAGH